MAGHVHRYRADVAWSGTTAVGYEHYDRGHVVEVPPTDVTLDLSGDAAFGGDARRANPEQLLVAAAASCQLLSFLAVAARARIDVVAYADDAQGEMPDDPTPMRLSRIVLRPRITVVEGPTDERLLHLAEVAHRECFIANSLRTEILVEPSFERVASPSAAVRDA